jgi:aryl-alcohol dehydrogenase-like predicted oxidoreductase
VRFAEARRTLTIALEAALMDTRTLGSLTVSVVGLGCNNFGPRLDAEATRAVVHAALDAGVNFFDTADIYGKGLSEEYVGRALGPRRGEVVLATKFGMEMDPERRGAHPGYIRRAVEDSLRRLGTDRIDLYQIHTPDTSVPIADTLGALDELVRAGKVREIGCSNFSVEQLREARDVAPGARFKSVQNEYSLFHRDPERGVLDECARQGLAFVPYFPLASGLLTGKYRRGQAPPQGTRITVGGRYAELLSDENLERVERLARYAEERGHTLLELAFAWLLARREVVSVIAGATSADQIRSNASASAWRLTDAERAEVDALVPASK